MAGIIKKVEQTLGMGGPKVGDKQSGQHQQGYGQHKQGYGAQQGGGFLDKVKAKIPGMGGQGAKGGEKKKNVHNFG